MSYRRYQPAFGEEGQGIYARAETQEPIWHVVMHAGKRSMLAPFIEPESIAVRGKMKASIRAKVRHPFGAIKQQSGFIEVRRTLFVLSNL